MVSLHILRSQARLYNSSRSWWTTNPVAVVSLLNLSVVPADLVVRLLQVGNEVPEVRVQTIQLLHRTRAELPVVNTL